MSYTTIWQCANDAGFVHRVESAAAQEGDHDKYSRVIWPTAAASDVEAAYASALAAGNPDPGGDEAVITDQMILSHVQASWPA